MIGILGSGSWATAVVQILQEQSDEQLCWWVREPEIRSSLAQYGRNFRYLPEVTLDTARLNICRTAQAVVERCDTIYLVVPTAYLHGALQQVDPELLRQKKLISAIKGFVPISGEIVTDYLQHTYNIAEENMGIISGPTHAEEVARHRLTYITAASPNSALAEETCRQIRCNYINASPSNDMRGIQYATALKNIYAVAAGICKGMDCGDNLLAVLVSYAIIEMMDCLKAIDPSHNYDLTPAEMPPYVGDLLVTCYSQYSRNRTFGTMIGRGYSVQSAQLEMNMVAEGYYAVQSMERLRQRMGIEMPIVQGVYRVLYEQAKPAVILRAWKMS